MANSSLTVEAAEKLKALCPIGYLGPEASNAHLAAQHFLSFIQKECLQSGQINAEELEPYGSLYDVFRAVSEQKIPSAVVPVENGLHGSVSEVLEVMMTGDICFDVIADFVLPIKHALIHKHPEATLNTLQKKLKVVLSHPQALAQCRETLLDMLGSDIELKSVSSTSKAVRQLTSFDDSYAALGTALAADLYDATVVLPNLSDRSNNKTRFMWIMQSDKAQQFKAELASLLFKKEVTKGTFKTTICVGIKDRPGCLVDLLLVFKAYGVNLTRIESRPSKKQLGQYHFYIDVDCDLTEPKYERVWMYLEADSIYLRRLGPYYCLDEL